MSGNIWQNARFLEYRNTGVGATVNSNRPRLSDFQGIRSFPTVPGGPVLAAARRPLG